MIVIDRALLGAGDVPDAALLLLLLDQHNSERLRLDELREIYKRQHAILGRRRPKGLPNNRLVHDLPGYIVTISAGYLVGNPVQYTVPDELLAAFEPVRDAYDAASVESVDAELAVDAAVYGKAVELCYADADARPRVAQVSARDSFVVYDDTVEHRPIFGVRRRVTYDAQLKPTGEEVTVYTAAEIVTFARIGNEAPQETGRTVHHFGSVPMVEYWNNAAEAGDFEPVMTLVDAYDALQSDRVNDKQQFTDAIFVLKGIGALGVDDTEEYVGGVVSDGDAPDGEVAGCEPVTAQQKEQTDPSVRLRQTRTLFLPGDGADAAFVTKPDVESGNETLRLSLKSDIHKFSLVPDLTDEHFAGNASGVAMRYKLFGLEQLTKIKERWFREGLRTRLKLFAAFLAVKGAAALDVSKVQITFTRALPVNELETAQTLAAYQGMVPQGLLLAQVPFVEDAEEAMRMQEREQAAALRRQQAAFEAQGFREPEED